LCLSGNNYLATEAQEHGGTQLKIPKNSKPKTNSKPNPQSYIAMKKLILFKSLILLVAFTSAQVIHVPGGYGSIQEGIDAANKGDTVLVDTGTYFENINFRGKAITVSSHYLLNPDSVFINNTIIDGSNPTYADSAAVITFCNGEDSASIICGFTITGGMGNTINVPALGEIVVGGGICCDQSGAKIIHNKIKNNQVSHPDVTAGGGIGANEQGDLWIIIRENSIENNLSSGSDFIAYGGGAALNGKALLIRNRIQNNRAHSQEGWTQGGGVYIEASIYSPDSMILHENIFSANVSECNGEEARGGGLFILYGQPIVTGNTFINNSCIGNNVVCFGGAISFWSLAGDLVFSDNLISGNYMESSLNLIAPGVHIWEPSGSVTFMNNVLYRNIVTKDHFTTGGGAFIVDVKENELIVDGNKFQENQAMSAGGLNIRWCYNVSVTNNLFSGNDAYRGGGMTIRQDQPTSDYKFEIINNTFYQNTADDWGGAIRMYDNEGGNVVTFNNIFWENIAQNDGSTISNSSDDTIFVYKSNINPVDIQGYWSGDENINVDPLFAPGDSLCHLSISSNCVNAGTEEITIGSQIYYCPDHDFDGEWRPMNGIADIGADEYAFTGISDNPALDRPFMLSVNPNPSSGVAHLRYLISDVQYAICEVFSINGVVVKSHSMGNQVAGEYSMDLDLSALPNGIYFIRLHAGKMVETAKIVLLK
jgi:hypothetical protein